MYKLALTVCCLLMLIVGAHADTILFVPPAVTGSNPLSNQVTAGPITVNGYVQSGSTWVDAPLWLRTGTNDNGLGVCSEGSACRTGGGDVNELDDAGAAELIRLTLASGYTWDSVQVSSLDRNNMSTTSSSTLWEHGELYGSNSPDFASATLLCQFVQGGSGGPACTQSGSAAEPTLTLTSGNDFTYLFFRAFNWETGGTNNDYLVYGATVTQTTTTPEPASMLLLGAGLAGLALRRKKNR